MAGKSDAISRNRSVQPARREAREAVPALGLLHAGVAVLYYALLVQLAGGAFGTVPATDGVLTASLSMLRVVSPFCTSPCSRLTNCFITASSSNTATLGGAARAERGGARQVPAAPDPLAK